MNMDSHIIMILHLTEKTEKYIWIQLLWYKQSMNVIIFRLCIIVLPLLLYFLNSPNNKDFVSTQYKKDSDCPVLQVSRLRLSCAASIIIWFVLPFDTNCQSKKTNVSFTDQLYLVQEFILLRKNQRTGSEKVFQGWGF